MPSRECVTCGRASPQALLLPCDQRPGLHMCHWCWGDYHTPSHSSQLPNLQAPPSIPALESPFHTHLISPQSRGAATEEFARAQDKQHQLTLRCPLSQTALDLGESEVLRIKEVTVRRAEGENEEEQRQAEREEEDEDELEEDDEEGEEKEDRGEDDEVEGDDEGGADEEEEYGEDEDESNAIEDGRKGIKEWIPYHPLYIVKKQPPCLLPHQPQSIYLHLQGIEQKQHPSPYPRLHNQNPQLSHHTYQNQSHPYHRFVQTLSYPHQIQNPQQQPRLQDCQHPIQYQQHHRQEMRDLGNGLNAYQQEQVGGWEAMKTIRLH
ncbi:unnamed protein product [Protopolystoma xenopodis]|uniref:Uncharacterized protein n=1 Tax=Protopolystoma xenopodis TaxID=117903 RepID=A0A448WTJ6_9PLAT|nr:unnamed protein product [Protopolystoma xenopodis]